MTDIIQICTDCKGTGFKTRFTGSTEEGEITSEEYTCPVCDGNGEIVAQTIDLGTLLETIADMADKVNDVIQKLDGIWEVLPDGWKE